MVENAPAWLKLPTRAAKLEKEIAAHTCRDRPRLGGSSNAPGEQILYLVLRSQQRVVQDRIRNYLQNTSHGAGNYRRLQAYRGRLHGWVPQSSKKAKSEMIANRLDLRPKKESEPEIV
jgi:ribosomal protein L13